MKGNLLASNKIDTEIIGQHTIIFREADSNKLLQLKLYPLFHLNFISTWIALLISYLAYIRSKMRHVCSNYFGSRNIKPRLESFEKVDASMMAYSKASKKKRQKAKHSRMGCCKIWTIRLTKSNAVLTT